MHSLLGLNESFKEVYDKINGLKEKIPYFLIEKMPCIYNVKIIEKYL